MLTFTRLYTGDDQQSHFEDVEVPLTSLDLGAISEKFPVTGLYYRTLPANYKSGWHITTTRQFVIILSGGVEIEVGDGTRRVFSEGDVFLSDDKTGQGHTSFSVNNQPRVCLFVTLE